MSENLDIRFQRSNFVVSDLDRALDFYCNVLGFDLEFSKESEKTSYSYKVFEIDPDAGLRFAVLSTKNAPRCMALTEITGQALPEMPLPRRSAIVIEVPDFDETVRKCREAGCIVYDEEQLTTNDGRLGREQGVVDPDGNLVVLYLITQKPS